jgi:hypothetical protein
MQRWSAGSSLTWRLADLPVGEQIDLSVSYANASGSPASLTYSLDGGASGTLRLASLPSRRHLSFRGVHRRRRVPAPPSGQRLASAEFHEHMP